MKFTGIADEAGSDIHTQIQATRTLGWDSIELRNVSVNNSAAASIHEIPQSDFENVADVLQKDSMNVCGIGSTIGNWAHPIDDPFEITLEELTRLIPRAQQLNVNIIRIMSYAVRKNNDGSDAADQRSPERFQRLREISKRLTDAGLIPAHENCMNYGGMGIRYTEELLSEVPGLKLVFDTGNPVFNRDRTKPHPQPFQNAWDFYRAIADNIVHVHIKDCVWNPAKQDAEYLFPGEGHGFVREILADLKKRAYTGYVSIEPHMAVVFHDPKASDLDDKNRRLQFNNFVEYGQKLESLVNSLS